MFQYIYPQFQIKRLLRAEMLEQLRDYPKSFISHTYTGFADGVVSGCGITWDHGELTVGPGMIYQAEKMYFMERPYTIVCGPEDRLRYLKVSFTEEYHEPGKITGSGLIVLDEQEADGAYEIELCRFRLQEGARLRHRYENLEDYSTEYDTVNLIHAPYAAKTESTLAPILLKQYAKEILEVRPANPYDISFAMNILAQDGSIPLDCINAYLRCRSDVRYISGDRCKVYLDFIKVLKEIRHGDRDKGMAYQKDRGVMLL